MLMKYTVKYLVSDFEEIHSNTSRILFQRADEVRRKEPVTDRFSLGSPSLSHTPRKTDNSSSTNQPVNDKLFVARMCLGVWSKAPQGLQYTRVTRSHVSLAVDTMFVSHP